MFIIRQRWPVVPTTRDMVPAAVIFALLLIVLHFFDAPFALDFRNLPGEVVAVMKGVTRFGEADWVLIPALVVALLCVLFVRIVPQPVFRRAAAEIAGYASFLFVGVAAPGLVTALVKRVAGRGRPDVFDAHGDLYFRLNWSAYDYQSFPSGHATTAFALAMVVAFLMPRLFWPALIFAIAIAWSRMALGAHYLTDVTVGAAVGTIGAYLVRNWFADRGWLFRWQADGQAVPRAAAIRRAFRLPGRRH